MESKILSPRERQVLHLIAYENTNVEIAEMLYISDQTVKSHRKNLLQKLSVKNTAGLVRRGFELGLLSTRKKIAVDQHLILNPGPAQRVISMIILIVLCLIPGASLFSQINSEANVIEKTTVDYDCNSPNATVTFPLNGDGICLSAPLLRWMKIYNINPDGSETLVGKVSVDNELDNLVHEETCGETSDTYPAGAAADEPFCRYYDICNLGNILASEVLAYTEVPNGSFAERYLKLTVPSQTGIMRLEGDYDFGYDGFPGDNGFDVNFLKQEPFPGVDCPGYETPAYNFSPTISSVSVSSLPEPICGDISGVTTTSALDALNATESEYLLTKRGEGYSFRVNVTHENQLVNNGTLQVIYKSDASTPGEKDSILFSTQLMATTQSTTQSFLVSFTPPKGSLGDVLQVRIIELNDYNIYIPIAVEGIVDDRVPILGSFLTPMVPHLILHDPPGDRSYAKMTQSEKICRTETTNLLTSDSKGFSATAQVGIEYSAEFIGIFSANFQATIATTGTFKYTTEVFQGKEVQTCVEAIQEYQTDDVESRIGPSADRFIGSARRGKYGIYDQVMIENCSLKIESGLAYTIDPDGGTGFNFTEKKINTMLDAERAKVNDLSKSLLEREQAYNQIQVWEQILDRNKSNRDNASYPETQVYSGPAPDPRTFTTSENNVYNFNYNTVIEGGLSIEATALIAGNGIYGGPQFSWTTTRGSSITDEQGVSKTISYIIEDSEGEPDFHEIQIDEDPDYGTPMFRLGDLSRTSNPYEGGDRLDRPRIYVNKEGVQCPYITRENVMTDTDTILIWVCNDHPTETRSFDVMVSTSNPELPNMEINATDLSTAESANFGTIPANGCLSRRLFITKKPLINKYDDIYLRVYPSGLSGTPPDTETSFLDWIADENDSLIINITFGGPGNYPPDMDCDGIVDNLDPCPNTTSEGDDDCDGFVNALDPCPLDSTNSDADLDGFLDCVDLCPSQLEATLDFDRDPAIPYDNMADFVEIPHDPLLNLPQNDFTIEAWVKPTDNFFKTIASKGDGIDPSQTVFMFNIWERNESNPANGRLALFLGGGWQTSDNQVPLNRWSHVAVTYSAESGQASFYIDGQLSGIRTYGTPYLSDTQPFYIGRMGHTANGNLYCFKGAMDDLIIWNRTLEQEEIVLTMSHSLNGTENKLVAYYRFDQHPPCTPGGTTTLIDDGPNAFNGTLINFDMGTNANGLGDPCISNWSQGRNADIDQDGLGDLCSTSLCLSQDSDNDGYSDCIDLCPTTQDASLQFNGTNWAETITDPNIVGNSSFAFSAWIYATSDEFSTIASQGNGSSAQTAFILSKVAGDGSVFPQKDRNKIGLFLANGTSAEWKLSNSAIPLNEWTHIAVSVSGSEVTFYINGEFDGKQTYAFFNYYSSGVGHLFIGRQGQVCNCNYFKGRLDDISIWSKSFNYEEVRSLFSGRITGNELDLITAYDFNNQGAPCQQNAGGFIFANSLNGSHLVNLWNFDVTSGSCERNWARARNIDSDNDGIGDACEVSTFACASTAGTGGPGADFDYLEDCLDFCPTSTETSLKFDGFNDFAYVNHNQTLNLADGSFTLGLWVKPGETAQDVSLISKGHGLDNTTVYNLVVKGDQVPQLRDKVGLNLSGEWVFSNSRIQPNEWSHIAITFDILSRTVRFYINGLLDSQPRILNSTGLLYNIDMNELLFGRDRSGITSYFIGSMEDIILWDKTLSEDEILQTMEAPLQGNEANLVAYYKCNDGVPYAFNSIPAANTLVDSGPNGLNGVLQDFALVGTVSNWAPGRNIDSDGDGMGDGCDDGLPCPPNYAGINALDNSLLFSNNYETQGIIESSQMINTPINVIYNSASSINLLPGFEVNQAVLEVRNDGCNQNQN